jgi:hypothetical protein
MPTKPKLVRSKRFVPGCYNGCPRFSASRRKLSDGEVRFCWMKRGHIGRCDYRGPVKA